MGVSSTDVWPQRIDSLAGRSTSSASSSSMRSMSTRWKPSWLSKSTATPDSQGSSRRQSSCTTRSSVSTSTTSSTSTTCSDYANTYQLPSTASHRSSTHKDNAGPFDSAADATLALASLAEDSLDLGEEHHANNEHMETARSQRNSEIGTIRRTESRATSTVSKASSNPRDLPAGFAEVEMFAREYHGYWRPSFTGALPPTAAICGTMLLTARLSAQFASAKMSSTDPELRDQAQSLHESLDEAASPEQAMQQLHECKLEAIIMALRHSLDAANLPMVPERPSWSIYEKIAQTKNHPDKLLNLWKNVSKLLKKIPPEQMVTIMFLLSVARRLQSRGIEIDGRSPAVYLLQKVWPRYVSEDASKLLLLHYDHMPLDLPLVLEAVNYRFSGRRCNLLALGAARTDNRSSIERGPRGVQEMCPV